MLILSLREQSFHDFVLLVCDATYKNLRANGWWMLYHFNTFKTSAWIWVVESGWWGLFPCLTMPNRVRAHPPLNSSVQDELCQYSTQYLTSIASSCGGFFCNGTFAQGPRNSAHNHSSIRADMWWDLLHVGSVMYYDEWAHAKTLPDLWTVAVVTQVTPQTWVIIWSYLIPEGNWSWCRGRGPRFCPWVHTNRGIIYMDHTCIEIQGRCALSCMQLDEYSARTQRSSYLLDI